MRRRLRVISALTILIPLSFLCFLSFTQTGLQLLVRSAEAILDEQLSVEDVSGHLLGDWSLTGLFFESPALSISLQTINCTWRPKGILSKKLHLQDISANKLVVKIKESKENEEKKEKKETSISPVTLPIGIFLDQVRLEKVSLKLEEYAKNIELDMVVLRMHADKQQIEIEEFRVDSQGAEATLHGSLVLGNAIQWSAALTLKEINLSLLKEDLAGTINAEIHSTGSLENKRWRGLVDLRTLQGNIKDHSLSGSGKIECIDSLYSLSSLQLESGDATLSVSGHIGDNLDAQFALLLPEITDFYQKAGGMAEIKGTLKGKLSSPHLDFSFQGEQLSFGDTVVDKILGNGSAQITEEGMGTAAVELTEVHQDGKVFSGSLIHGEGTLDQHTFQADLGPELGDLDLLLSGGLTNGVWHGRIETLNISYPEEKPWSLERPTMLTISSEEISTSSLCLQYSSEKVCLEGSWLPGEEWAGNLAFENFDPNTLIAGWPGSLSGELVGKGRFQGGEDEHHISLKQITGDIQGESVEGFGKVSIIGDTYFFERVTLKKGTSHLYLSGKIQDEMDVNVNIASPDLSKIYSPLRGRLHLDSAITGQLSTPRFKLEMNLENMVFENFEAEKLQGSVVVDLQEGGTVYTDIQGSHLRVGDFDISQLTTAINGTKEEHTIEAGLSFKQGQLTTRATGTLIDRQWQGVFSRLDFMSPAFGKWQLAKDGEVFFSPELVKARDFCVEGAGTEGCLSGEWHKDSLWKATVRMPSLSLDVLKSFRLFSVPVKGQAKIFAELQGDGGIPKRAKVEILVPQASINVTPDAEKSHAVQVVDTSYHLELKDQVLVSKLYLQTDKGSTVKSEVKVDGIQDAMKDFTLLPLKGTVSLDIKELVFLSLLTDFGLKTSGSLEGDLLLDGTIGNPLMDGKMDLIKGSLSIPSLGINLEQLQIALEAQGERIRLISTSQSKEGGLKEEGILTFGGPSGWEYSSTLKGDNFLLIDLPEYEIFAEPDLDLVFNGKGGTITGKLVLPHGRIAPSGGAGKVTASGDVVFVDEGKKTKSNTWGLTTNISIVFGDDVNVDTYGLRGRLDGNVSIKDVPGKDMTAKGNISVRDGTFEMYNLSLDIERGRLFFVGGPIDNPGIDVRAQRTIDETVVGVDIGGTAHDIEVNLFSNPHMEDSEILAFLVVGRSGSKSNRGAEDKLQGGIASLGILGTDTLLGGLNNGKVLDEVHLEGGSASEDMSIVVGKNITKDLFIGYDHNFFDSTGEFRVRYKLGKGFSIETRSGVNSTSGDLLYSIER